MGQSAKLARKRAPDIASNAKTATFTPIGNFVSRAMKTA
jgi:hypothetical protein